MNSISMHTISHSLVVTNGAESKTINNDGKAVVMGGITYTLKDSTLTMTSDSSDSLKKVTAFFSYSDVKYDFNGKKGQLKSSDMSERIKNNTGEFKNVFREVSEKWKYEPNLGEKSILDKLKNSKIKESDLGKYKTMGDVNNDPKGALDFFKEKHTKEKNDDYRNDYRRIVKGILELSSRCSEVKEVKEVKKVKKEKEMIEMKEMKEMKEIKEKPHHEVK